MALSSFGGMASVLNIVREVDLKTIKTEAEEPFSFLIVGDGTLPYELAEALSATEGKQGIHPWLHVVLSPLDSAQTVRGTDLALLVTGKSALSTDESQSLATLNHAGIPVLTVVVGALAQQRVGSEMTRPGEVGRVAIESLDGPQIAGRVVPAMLAALPSSIHLSLAHYLPVFRKRVINELIEDTSRANALYSASTSVGELIPGLNIPFVAADVLILTKNQFIMAYKIALAAGKQGEPNQIMGEVASVLGGGLIFRQAARELVGLVPVIGIVPKIAVAYAGTRVIGRTASAWAMEDVQLATEDVRALYDEALQRGRALANRLRRGDSEALPAPAEESAAVARNDKQRPSRWQQVRNRLPFVGESK